MSRAEDIFQKLIYFGEEAIDDYIINSQSEELFLDFKRADSSGKNGTALHKDDRKNLAKCISGFGNSEGGVVIWGVECSRNIDVGDVARAKLKVKNVYRFLSWLEGAISGCTIPSHNKIRNHIVSADENGDGFVATYIPKSEIAPLMTTIGSTFYIRSGSNNVPAPYSVLSGMFGRRPQPEIKPIFTDKKIVVQDNQDADMLYPNNFDGTPEKYIKLSFSVKGENDSNVIARELYLSWTTISDGGEYNKIRFLNYNQMDAIQGQEGQLNIITRPDLRVPPRSIIRFTNVELVLSPYIEEDLFVDGVMGADGSAPHNFRIYLPKNKLRSFISKAIREDADANMLLNEFFSEYLSGDFL